MSLREQADSRVGVAVVSGGFAVLVAFITGLFNWLGSRPATPEQPPAPVLSLVETIIAVGEAPDDLKVVRRARRLWRLQLARPPRVGADRVVERVGHDADDGVHAIADADRQFAERPFCQPRAPVPPAHDGDRGRARLLLVGRKPAPDCRPDAEHVEELARDGRDACHRDIAIDGRPVLLNILSTTWAALHAAAARVPAANGPRWGKLLASIDP